MAETTTRFSTSGMHCHSCSRVIDMELADLPGVIEARADHAAGMTVVTYDDDVVTAQRIAEAITGVGYPAVPVVEA